MTAVIMTAMTVTAVITSPIAVTMTAMIMTAVIMTAVITTAVIMTTVIMTAVIMTAVIIISRDHDRDLRRPASARSCAQERSEPCARRAVPSAVSIASWPATCGARPSPVPASAISSIRRRK